MKTRETNSAITLPSQTDKDNLPENFSPKSNETKVKWLQIFEDYKVLNKSMEDIAIINGISTAHASQVISWVNQQIGQSKEMGVYRRITVRKMEENMKRMNGFMDLMGRLLDKTLNKDKIDNNTVKLYQGQIRDLVSVSGEIRKHLETIGKLMQVIDTHKQGPVVQVVNMPNVKRGTGVKQVLPLQKTAILQEDPDGDNEQASSEGSEEVYTGGTDTPRESRGDTPEIQ